MAADTGRSEWSHGIGDCKRDCGSAKLHVCRMMAQPPEWEWHVHVGSDERVAEGTTTSEAEAKKAAEDALSQLLNGALCGLCGAGWVVVTRADREFGHGMRKDVVALREDGAVRAAFLTYENLARLAASARSGKGPGKALDAALDNLVLELRRVLR